MFSKNLQLQLTHKRLSRHRGWSSVLWRKQTCRSLSQAAGSSRAYPSSSSNSIWTTIFKFHSLAAKCKLSSRIVYVRISWRNQWTVIFRKMQRSTTASKLLTYRKLRESTSYHTNLIWMCQVMKSRVSKTSWFAPIKTCWTSSHRICLCRMRKRYDDTV